MRKNLLIGLSIAAISSAAFMGGAVAQAVANPPLVQSEQKAPPATQPAQTGPADNQIADEVDAKIAQLKASLRLALSKEKNLVWASVRTSRFWSRQFKTRANEGTRRYGRRRRDDQSQQSDRPNDIALMRQDADELPAARATSLKTLANAAEPLYGALNDKQKEKLIRYLNGAFESGRR